MTQVRISRPRARSGRHSTASLPSRLRRACSPYTGIVRSLEECLSPSSEPRLFRFACEVSRGRALLGSPLDHLSGVGGSGRSRSEAASAAVGEALERYSASYVPGERIVVARAAELAEEAVDPRSFALFSERQYESKAFPYEPFTRETVVPWIRGWAISDGRPVWIPAELVLLADAVPDGASHIGYATSNGTACAETTSEALVRALCELLERDAFMIVWANRLSLPLIEVGEDATLSALDRRFFEKSGLRYATVDLSCVHRLPSVLGVVRAPDWVGGALGVGAGTAPSLIRAWWKALAEAFSARAAGVKLDQVEHTPLVDADDVASFEDHIRYYADHPRARAAAFLDASAERSSPGSIPTLEGETPEEQVRALAERVEAAGASVYAADVTSPDVGALGFSVVKVLAPQLCQLDVPQSARHLGGRRLSDAPVALGLRRSPLAETDLNRDPHPFP